MNSTVGTRIAIKDVLFATDFSLGSDVALGYAAALARRFGATLTTLHVLDFPPYIPEESQNSVLADLRADAAGRLFDLGRHLGDLRHEEVIRVGDVPLTITLLAEETGMDMVVLSTGGRSGLQKFLLGSVAEEVFRACQVPVMTVGPSVKESSSEAIRFGRIILPIDFSDQSLKAIPYALSLADQSEALVTVVNVSAAPLTDSECAASLEHLRRVVPTDACPAPEFEICEGNPSEQILKLANDISADLIVLGVRPAKWTRASTHLPWDTAHRVVAAAPCPVLTVRGNLAE